jgi:hypothetical protein
MGKPLASTPVQSSCLSPKSRLTQAESSFSIIRERVASEFGTGVFPKLGGRVRSAAAKQPYSVRLKPGRILPGNFFRRPLSRCIGDAARRPLARPELCTQRLSVAPQFWRRANPCPERPACVPLTGPAGLPQQLGTREYSRDRRFRGKLVSWLRQIRAFWPECPAAISPCGRSLVIESSKGSPAIKSA